MNDFTNCPYWGIGGHYVADPVSGLRTRVVEGVDPTAQPAAHEPTDTVVATETPVKPLKEKK
jgi:hypothetical protein